MEANSPNLARAEIYGVIDHLAAYGRKPTRTT